MPHHSSMFKALAAKTLSKHASNETPPTTPSRIPVKSSPQSSASGSSPRTFLKSSPSSPQSCASPDSPASGTAEMTHNCATCHQRKQRQQIRRQESYEAADGIVEQVLKDAQKRAVEMEVRYEIADRIVEGFWAVKTPLPEADEGEYFALGEDKGTGGSRSK